MNTVKFNKPEKKRNLLHLSAKIELPTEILQHELRPNTDFINDAVKKTVLATSSFYKPNKYGDWNPIVQIRAQAALRMFRQARDIGHYVVCVDEFSDNGWKSEARALGVQLVYPDFEIYKTGNSNMGRCRRQAVDLAAQTEGKQVVSWLEPEKYSAVLNSRGQLPLAMAATVILDGRADWVIPRRENNGAGYPATQQFMERAGNAFAQNLMISYASKRKFSPEQTEQFAQYLDHFFGPKMFGIKGNNARYFANYGEIAQKDDKFNDQWGSVHYPPFLALLEGNRVAGVPIDYIHPREQTLAESFEIKSDLKRYEQGYTLARTLAHLLNRDLEMRGIEERLSL